MKVKFLPKYLNKKSNQLYNQNERLATNLVNPPRFSNFDLSFSHTTTFNNSKLIPIAFLECLPGDTYNIDINAVIRQSSPKAATLENPRSDFAAFFVPLNVIWKEFKYLMGETKNAGFQPEITNTPIIEYSTGNKYDENDLASYLGIPQNIDMSQIGVNISSLPFKAYIQIWNDWYRDENLQSEIDNTNNNNNNSNVISSNYWNESYEKSLQVGKGLAPVSRLPDYFSTCLPFPQAGENIDIFTNYGIDLSKIGIKNGIQNSTYGMFPFVPQTFFKPSSTDIPNTGFENYKNGWNDVPTISNKIYPDVINYNGLVTNNAVNGSIWSNLTGNYQITQHDGFFTTSPLFSRQQNLTSSPTFGILPTLDTRYLSLFSGNNKDFANITSSSPDSFGGFSINDLRGAIALQHFNETNARGGRRYIEIIRSHFGVKAPDDILYRSQYIGGFKQNINIENVVQSSNGNLDSPLGSIGGYSITGIGGQSTITYSSKVHGYIMVCVCVRPQVRYSQGLPKIFTKTEKLDFYFPEFANIGEQPVKNFELYLSEISNDNNKVFGYNEAFADYRYNFNKLSGFMSVNNPNSFSSYFVYTEKYSGSPILNADWMKSNPNIISSTMLFNSNQVEFIHDFLADFYFKINATRPLPVMSIPGIDKI